MYLCAALPPTISIESTPERYHNHYPRYEARDKLSVARYLNNILSMDTNPNCIFHESSYRRRFQGRIIVVSIIQFNRLTVRRYEEEGSCWLESLTLVVTNRGWKLIFHLYLLTNLPPPPSLLPSSTPYETLNIKRLALSTSRLSSRNDLDTHTPLVTADQAQPCARGVITRVRDALIVAKLSKCRGGDFSF